MSTQVIEQKTDNKEGIFQFFLSTYEMQNLTVKSFIL